MKKNDLFSLLQCSKNEQRVYEALVRSGARGVAGIVQDAGIHRPAVYRALEVLLAKGFVATVPKGKRTLYNALSPEVLRGALTEQLLGAEEAIEPLLATYNKKPQRPKVEFLEGMRAIEEAYMAIPRSLKKGDVYYRYSARDITRGLSTVSKRALQEYQKVREEKELERFVITGKRSYEKKHVELTRAIKMVPPDFDLFQHDVSQLIYGSTILIIDYASETAIRIENPTMAHFQRRIFQLLWKLLPGRVK